MTIRELVVALGEHPLVVLAVVCVPPVAVLLLRLLHGKGGGGRAPWRYGHALMAYAACIPGMFSTMLTAYSLLLAKENLLDQDALVYLAPIVSMVVTLVLMGKVVSFGEVPGFDRITGLMTLLGLTFLLLLILDRFRVWVIFGGSIFMMIAIGAFLFALLKWGAGRLFRGPGEAKQERPTFRP